MVRLVVQNAIARSHEGWAGKRYITTWNVSITCAALSAGASVEFAFGSSHDMLVPWFLSDRRSRASPGSVLPVVPW